MKNFLSIAVLLLVSISLLSFDSKESGKLYDEPKWEKKEVVKTYEGCNLDSQGCTYARINYIQMTEGKAKDKINNEILNMITSNIYVYDETPSKTPEETAEAFVAGYVEVLKEGIDLPGVGWYIDVNIHVANQLSAILCLDLSFEMYSGGAHPVYYTIYNNYDYNTGKPVLLSDILIPGYEKALDSLVDKSFRKTYNLAPGDDLADKIGLFENEIHFNDNYCFTRNGIVFIYNIYEIAPYAAGAIDVRVPYSDLIDLIDENGLGIY